MGCEGVWALCVERVLYRGVPVHSRLFASSLGQAKAQPRAKYDDEFENHTRSFSPKSTDLTCRDSTLARLTTTWDEAPAIGFYSAQPHAPIRS